MSQPVPVAAPARVRAALAASGWRWVVGVALGLVVLGPGLAPGPLLNLDLLVTPHIPVPNGVYGLGPALTQRVPFFALLAAGSWALGGPLAVKGAVVLLIALGFVGAARLVGPAGGRLAETAAGVLWAAGPYALTRLGVGHLNLIWAVGVFPWAVPRLCRPSAAPRRTFLAVLLLAVGGPAAGTLGLAVVAVGLLVEPRRERRWGRVAGVSGAASLIWVAPTVVVLWAGAEVSTAGNFDTTTGSVGGWLELFGGGGFWRADQQVGAGGLVAALVGVVLLGLAVMGGRDLDARWARPAAWAAGVGLVLTAASAVPVVRDGYRWLSLLPVGAPLRESQRFLALWLVWLAPAAALGGGRLARRLAEPDRVPARLRAAAPGLAGVALVLPMLAGLSVSVPGWWGLDGRLEPVTFPSGWARARTLVRADPGPVVVLPWNEYPSLSFARDQTVFNPAPDYLGGDVISSYDPGFDQREHTQEQIDRRARVVDGLVTRVEVGAPVSAELADLGVRWVFVAKETGWEKIGSVAADPGLDLVLDDPAVALYEVRAWEGVAVAADGTAHRVDRRYPPVITTDAPAGTVLSVAGAPGWLQGWGRPVAVTADGRLRLPADGGIVWFWPTLLLLLLDVSLLGAAVVAIGPHRRRSAANVV